MDPSLMERVEIVKGPIAALGGGAGAQQNNNGAGGAINLYLKGAQLRESSRQLQETTTLFAIFGMNVILTPPAITMNALSASPALLKLASAGVRFS